MTAADLMQLVVRLLCLEGLLFALERDEAFAGGLRTEVLEWMLGAALVIVPLAIVIAVTAWRGVAALVRWWRARATAAAVG